MQTQFELQQEQVKASQDIANQLESLTIAIGSLETALTANHGPSNWSALEAIVEMATITTGKHYNNK